MKLENQSDFYLLYKPNSWTSQDLCTFFKKKYNFKKVGHSGTLDPSAEGLMLIATNKYTKLFDYIDNTHKTYEFEALFGFESETNDTDSELVEIESINLESKLEELDKGISGLTGNIKQVPPIYSAIKVKGKRLYKYARQEKEVELPIRDVAVNNFKLISYEGNKAKFIATVSKGTYIRSLIVDLAKSIGTKAVVSSINRIEIGTLNKNNANVIKNIEQIERSVTPEPLDWRILFDIPTISVEDSVLKDIKNGNFLKSSLFGTDVPHIIENKNSIVAIYEPYNENKFKPQKVLIWKFTKN